jgi:integrase
MKAVLIRSLKKRGNTEIRRVPVPGFLVKALASIASEKRHLIWPFSRTRGWRMIKAVMKAAKISGIHATAKGLRHAFGVRGAMVQIPVSLIQGWMGHADPSTTAIYLAVKDDEERELIEKTW